MSEIAGHTPFQSRAPSAGPRSPARLRRSGRLPLLRLDPAQARPAGRRRVAGGRSPGTQGPGRLRLGCRDRAASPQPSPTLGGRRVAAPRQPPPAAGSPPAAAEPTAADPPLSRLPAVRRAAQRAAPGAASCCARTAGCACSCTAKAGCRAGSSPERRLKSRPCTRPPGGSPTIPGIAARARNVAGPAGPAGRTCPSGSTRPWWPAGSSAPSSAQRPISAATTSRPGAPGAGHGRRALRGPAPAGAALLPGRAATSPPWAPPGPASAAGSCCSLWWPARWTPRPPCWSRRAPPPRSPSRAASIALQPASGAADPNTWMLILRESVTLLYYPSGWWTIKSGASTYRIVVDAHDGERQLGHRARRERAAEPGSVGPGGRRWWSWPIVAAWARPRPGPQCVCRPSS